MSQTLRSSDIDPSVLPAEAQQQLHDFYQFLVAKYGYKTGTGKIDIHQIVPRKVKAFEPLAREMLYDR